jgi:hypothetical protein
LRNQAFISYSHEDEKLMKELLTHLKPYLRSGAVTVWSDTQIASGSRWFAEIQGALNKTRVAILLVSPDFLASDFIHEHELGPLLKEAEAGWVKILWVQLRTSSYEETPLRDYQAVVSPPSKPLAKMSRAARDEAWVRVCKELKDAVAVNPLSGSPDSAETAPVTPQRTVPSQPVQALDLFGVSAKWADELRVYGEGFVGRREELSALDQAWTEGVRIFALQAEGGAGKTRVVVEWLRQMRDTGWRGARRLFVHSFYSQGSDERRNAPSELFFEQALAYFGYRGEPIAQADEKGRMLAGLLVEHHGLLVLDGLEPLQHPPLHAERGRLKDPGIARLLLSLANIPHDKTRGLCLITSRQRVVELEARVGATVVQQSLDHLHRDDGAELLRQFQVVGPDEELKKASDEFHGHAYSLMLLGSFLKNATDHHDIRRRGEIVLLEEDTEYQGHARKIFAAYVRHLGENSPEVAMLRLLGFFDRAAERQLLDVLRTREAVAYEWPEDGEPADRRSQAKRMEDSLAQITEPLLDLTQSQWNRVLNRLRDLRLIDLAGPIKSPALDAHPLLRECFAEQVQTQFPAAWQSGHRRLFEHLSGTALYWPEGIEGLRPLYQAVAHGCLAGLHQQACDDVYVARILRGTQPGGFYSTKTLGAVESDLAAVWWFFKVPWTTPEPRLSPGTQRWLLNEAASRLGMLSRLVEAEEPLGTSIRIAVEQDDWVNASISAANLSVLYLQLGEIGHAISAGEQAQANADRGCEAFFEAFSRTCLGEALHQAGRRNEALRVFEEAEVKYKAPLFSLLEFRYCELLLSESERATWKTLLALAANYPIRPLLASCVSVANRVRKTLEWIALDPHEALVGVPIGNLILARAALYYSALINAPEQTRSSDHITAALVGFHGSGQKLPILRGLLTRAWLRSLIGDQPGCQADLDEAWEIAERGPMPLFQADILLYRARLFRDRDALAEARRLIEKHGYHRRDEELADAEEAAKGW